MADISSVKLQDNQTYYFKDNSAIVSISRSGNTYTATRHDGTTFEFTQKDDNTTYTFEDGVNSFTVTPSNGTAQTVTVTPSIPNATQSSDGLMSATDKTKLDGVANGAEVNQNAFSNIKVGSTTLSADTKTDTLEFVAGDNITLTPTEASDKITISSSYTNTTYTLSQDGTDGHKFTLSGTDGYTKTITIPDANTTYTIEADTTNNKIKLIPSSGNAVSITVPFATNATNATNATKATQDESGNNIKATYAASFSISDHTITLKNKNGTSLGTVTVPDNNTTYTFAEGTTDKAFSVTPSGGNTQTVSIHGLGSASTKDYTSSVTSGSADLVTSGAVYSAIDTAIDNLPEPMIFKGTLGTNGTISTLPTASSTNEGWTYKVITANTYPTGEGSNKAKVGDMFICAELTTGTFSWVYVPSGDDVEDTWRNIKVDGTEKLTTAISSGAVDFVSGNHIGLSFNATGNKLTIAHADTSSQASSTNSGRTYIQSIGLDGDGHVTSLSTATETVVNTDRYVNSAAFDYDSTNDNIKMTLTRAGSDSATVVKNIPKVSSSTAGVVPKGTAVSSQSQNTKFLREDGTWAKPSYTTNTNTTYTIGTSGNTVTLTPSSGSVQSITVPFATNATNATKATQDANGDIIATTYRKLSNNDFDTINATEVNAGDLIVTGVGRFTNGLYGDLSGTATKVSNSLKIQLNGGTTEGTNQFTYDGSAAKTVNVTKSAIGLGNVDNTADVNKSVASANTAGSATKATQDESGNNIKATYAASFSISDHTITLKNKNGVSLGTVTVPDNNDNTWRKVQVNGTDILGTATNTNPLNLKAGTNVSLSNSSGTVTITATDTNTTYSLSASGESVVLSGSDNSSSTANLSTVFANYTPYKGNLTSVLGSASPASAMKTYWDNNDNIKPTTVNTAYNTAGQEYAFLLSKGDSNQYGAVIRWGYGTKYFEILRKYGSTWKDDDWVKMDAGYADTAGSATKATQDSDGNAINTTYLKLSGGTVTGQTTFNKSIHDAGGQTIFAGGATSSAWYKITLATNGITPPSSQQWYMCSMTIHVGGSYGSAAKGIIEVSYYFYWTGTAFQATNVYATAIGNNLNNINIYYKLTNPFVIYVNVASSYTSLWVDKVSYRDSSYAYRTNETKVEVSDAITTTDYSQIPIAKVYSTNGNNIFLNNSTFPSSNNSYNLGDPSYKWANVYATNFRGNNITLSTTSGISYEGTKNTYQMIRFIDNTNDAYGNGIAIGGGGQTIIGGGESAGVMVSNAGTSGEEIMYVGNDQNVVIFTGLQNGWDSKKTFTFDTAGALTATKFIGALQGNADTATTASKLGSSNVGSATQPIYLSAGTATACTYTLGKSVPSDAVFTDHYAWADITGKPSTFAPSAHDHSQIVTVGDKRTTATTPNDYANKLIFQGLKTQGYIDNPGGTSGYSYLVGLRGWSDSSGGDSHELAFNNNGIYWRHGATTTWGNWAKLFTASDTYSGTLTSSQVTTALGYTPYNSTNPNGYTSNTGTITSVKTTAGAHTTINVTSGAANFNVPTKTSHLTNDSGFVTQDTKNTAGSTDTSSKIFLIGATSQAANPQTYSDDQVYVTSGTLQTNNTYATVSLCANTGNSSTAGGISLYGTSPTTYGIAMRGTGNGGKHGYVQGDWAIYNYMTGADDRGWIYRHASTSVASISCAGHAVFNGSVTIGGNATNTSGVRQVYNETTKSLDFVFVA